MSRRSTRNGTDAPSQSLVACQNPDTINGIGNLKAEARKREGLTGKTCKSIPNRTSSHTPDVRSGEHETRQSQDKTGWGQARFIAVR